MRNFIKVTLTEYAGHGNYKLCGPNNELFTAVYRYVNLDAIIQIALLRQIDGKQNYLLLMSDKQELTCLSEDLDRSVANGNKKKCTY